MRLNKVEMVGIGLAVVIAVFALWNFVGNTKYDQQYNSNRNQDVKVDYGERITVSVRYISPEENTQKPTFYIALDTHWGDLFEYDIQSLTTLEVNGKTYKAINWTESPQSWGHHRKGLLEFPESALEEVENAESFKLVIKGIEKDRVFEWNK
jgi:hypothetical protein